LLGRFSLRGRVMLAYGLLALGLSSALALVTWGVVSDYLTQQRESSAVIETQDNAAALHYGIFGAPEPCRPARERAECGSPTPNPNVSVMDLLNTLPSTDSAAAMLYYEDQWYSLTGRPADLPSDLIASVRAGSTEHRRITVNGQQVLAVGVPLTRPGEAFFEWHPLDGLDNTLRTVKITLIAAAIVTAMIGLAVGRLASTLALRPLAELTRVADAVARGKLDARLQAENDRDLGGLARSFNQTAADLERRVAADARFAGDVSHELRTPLMTMLNSMQLIQNHSTELPAAVREPVELLGYDLDRFRRLVIDLLEISRDDADSKLTARLVWKSIRMKAKFAHLFARADSLYGLDDGIFACVDLQDGSLRWKEGRYGHGQGLLVGDLYLLMAESGELVLLRPTPDAPNELARFRVFSAKTWNPLAFSGDRLLVRNDQEAACLRLKLAAREN